MVSKRTVNVWRISSDLWSENKVRSLLYYSVLFSIIVVLYNWSQQELYDNVINRQVPRMFIIVSIAITLVVSLISLVYGKFEAGKTHELILKLAEPAESAEVTEHTLVISLFFQFVMGSFLLIGLFFPLFLPGAAISRLSWIDLLNGVAILFSTALFFRVLGYTISLTLGRRSLMELISLILVYCSLFILTAFGWEASSPLRLISYLNYGREAIAPLPVGATGFFHGIVLILVLLLTLVCYWAIRFQVRLYDQTS